MASVGALFAAGCASIGPPTIARDRFDYVASISESVKRQTLHNLLKVRYADAPVFIDVTSVINSYELEGEVEVSSQVSPRSRSGDTFLGLQGGGRYADRPTIAYTPLTGEKFARGLLSPFPIAAIAYLIQAGYPVDVVLRTCVNTINGLDNEFGGFGNPRAGDAGFAQLLALLREAQSAGELAFRVRGTSQGDGAALMVRAPRETSVAAIELLGLDRKAKEYRMVFGMFPTDGREIAIVTRSLLQVMTEFASYIDVPTADAAEQRVYVPKRSDEQLRLFPPPLRVRHSDAAPADAHVAVSYRGRWFWIDDRDFESKASLNILMFLFALTETGAPEGRAPVVTIPAR